MRDTIFKFCLHTKTFFFCCCCLTQPYFLLPNILPALLSFALPHLFRIPICVSTHSTSCFDRGNEIRCFTTQKVNLCKIYLKTCDKSTEKKEKRITRIVQPIRKFCQQDLFCSSGFPRSNALHATDDNTVNACSFVRFFFCGGAEISRCSSENDTHTHSRTHMILL